MTTLQTKINEAIQIANSQAQKLHGRKIHNSERAEVTAACLAIAQQHHNGILILLRNNPPLHATAFSLLRVFLEATIRGLWLAKIATDDQIHQSKMKSLDISLKAMIRELGDKLNVEKSMS